MYAVQQCRISPVTADATGVATTYGTSIPVPGCKNLKVTGSVNTVDLRGDNTFLDSDTMLQSIMVEIDHAKLNLDLLNTFLAGTIADTGTNPNQVTTWNVPNPPVFGYFKVEARAASVDTAGGDLHIVFGKVKLADFPQLGLVEENYQVYNLKCKAVPPLGTGAQWMSVVLNQTAAPIT